MIIKTRKISKPTMVRRYNVDLFLFLLFWLLLLLLNLWWCRSWFTHNFFNLFVYLFHLFLNLLDINHWIFIIRSRFLFLLSWCKPNFNPFNMWESFLSLLWSNMFVLFILNKTIITRLLRVEILFFKQSPRFLIYPTVA